MAATNPGVWTTLRDAFRGTPIDYTTAPIGRAVIMLAVPMVIEMAMESIFAVADVFWVAHLGADAVATVGLTESMLTMIYTVAMGLSIGAMALVVAAHRPAGSGRRVARGRAVDPPRRPRRGADRRAWRRRTRRTCCG